MRAIIVIGLLLAVDKGFSQEPNLVPNGGFEEYVECPTQISPPFVPSEVDKLLHWYNPTSGTPDYFNICANEINPYVGIPALNCNQFPYEGDGMIGIALYAETNRREYVSVRIKEHLLSGAYYRIRVRLAKSCLYAIAISNIGLAFTFDSLFVDTGFAPVIPISPQVFGPDSGFMDISNHWYEMNEIFLSTGGERYLTIGNFSDDFHTEITNDTSEIASVSYYFIDDVSVRRVEPPNSVKDSEMYSFDIYPNPATTTVAISRKSNRRISTLAITDLSGREVKIQSGVVREMDVSGLNNGVYMVQVQFENGAVAVRKLVVQKE